jgi:hypothetical protein
MDKLEATQRVLRFSESVRNWCEKDKKKILIILIVKMQLIMIRVAMEC